MMHIYNKVLNYIFIFTLILAAQNLEILAQKSGTTPLHKCWELNTNGAPRNIIASDNIKSVFLASDGGTISVIDVKDGTQIWQTDLGGNVAKIISGQEMLFVLSADDAQNTLSVRSLSTGTGIVKWQKNLNINQNAETDYVSLIETGEFLFLITSPGDFYKLSKDNGADLEKFSLNENITTEAKLIDQRIVVGSNKKNLVIYSIADHNVSKIAVDGIPAVIYTESGKILYSDKLGKITTLDKSGKKDWQTRLGAEISDITETEQGLAISSNDNFIYLISGNNGKKIWKKRFRGRTATAMDTQLKNSLVAVNLNSDLALFLDVESGKVINQITLPDSGFFIGKPLIINDRIIFQTNTGIVSYSSSTTGCLIK